MRVAFRADASTALGAGHVMRCLTLADELRLRGAETLFISRAHPGHLGGLIEARGHAVFMLPIPASVDAVDAAQAAKPPGADWRADAAATGAVLGQGVDWLVVDHYALDAAWESALRELARHVLVLDDMADRRHDGDLLLDQNLQAPGRYDGLLPGACQVLTGPRYALLRPEFHVLHRDRSPADGSLRTLLVFFGGGDATDETGKALDALRDFAHPGLRLEVVVGEGNPRRSAIQSRCGALPACHYHCQVDDMARLMAQADLALGAAGVSTWERACLGLPTLAVSVAENQHAIARAAAEAGVLTWLGDASQVDAPRWLQALERAVASPDLLRRQSRAGLALVDGLGARRVADRMCA